MAERRRNWLIGRQSSISSSADRWSPRPAARRQTWCRTCRSVEVPARSRRRWRRTSPERCPAPCRRPVRCRGVRRSGMPRAWSARSGSRAGRRLRATSSASRSNAYSRSRSWKAKRPGRASWSTLARVSSVSTSRARRGSSAERLTAAAVEISGPGWALRSAKVCAASSDKPRCDQEKTVPRSRSALPALSDGQRRLLLRELPDEQVQWERRVRRRARRDDRECQGQTTARPPQTDHGVAVVARRGSRRAVG